MATKTLANQAYEIYQKSGQSGVADWAQARKHKKYDYCAPCETEVPVHGGICLVCWTATEKKEKQL